MSSPRSLISDKVRCFSQSERLLYGNFIIILSRACNDSSATESCLTILDSAALQIKIKEALHIKWENPIFSQQLRYLDLSLSF